MVATPIPEGLQGWWWATLVAGLVVAVVLVLLLSWLYRSVLQIEEALGEIWTAGKGVARNTATTWMLEETRRALDGLNGELLEHDRLVRGERG